MFWRKWVILFLIFIIILIIQKKISAEESHHEDLHAGDYQLLGADLRQSKELKEKLESAGLDFDIPTIFIAECVLVYMSVDKSRELLSNIPNWFRTAVFINYEQVILYSDCFYEKFD